MFGLLGDFLRYQTNYTSPPPPDYWSLEVEHIFPDKISLKGTVQRKLRGVESDINR
jgi:hypothetical protein